jgi:hypothetical protein
MTCSIQNLQHALLPVNLSLLYQTKNSSTGIKINRAITKSSRLQAAHEYASVTMVQYIVKGSDN